MDATKKGTSGGKEEEKKGERPDRHTNTQTQTHPHTPSPDVNRQIEGS